MLGCTYGTMFKTSVAGGSYQEGLTVHLQVYRRDFISRKRRSTRRC